MTFLRDQLTPILGEGAAVAISYVLALLAVLLLIVVAVLLYRWLAGGRLSFRGKGHAPRLGIVDALPIDARRKLVLVRRDTVEHLILIGGANDLVVEPTIQRAAPARRPAEPAPGRVPIPAAPTPTAAKPPAVPPTPLAVQARPPVSMRSPAAAGAPLAPDARAEMPVRGSELARPAPQPPARSAPAPTGRPQPSGERAASRPATPVAVREENPAPIPFPAFSPPAERRSEAPTPGRSGPYGAATAEDRARPGDGRAVVPAQRAWPFPRPQPTPLEVELESGVSLEDYATWVGPVGAPPVAPTAPSLASLEPGAALPAQAGPAPPDDDRRANRVNSLENEMARLLGEIAGKKP